MVLPRLSGQIFDDDDDDDDDDLECILMHINALFSTCWDLYVSQCYNASQIISVCFFSKAPSFSSRGSEIHTKYSYFSLKLAGP